MQRSTIVIVGIFITLVVALVGGLLLQSRNEANQRVDELTDAYAGRSEPTDISARPDYVAFMAALQALPPAKADRACANIEDDLAKPDPVLSDYPVEGGRPPVVSAGGKLERREGERHRRVDRGPLRDARGTSDLELPIDADLLRIISAAGLDSVAVLVDKAERPRVLGIRPVPGHLQPYRDGEWPGRGRGGRPAAPQDVELALDLLRGVGEEHDDLHAGLGTCRVIRSRWTLRLASRATGYARCG